MTMYYYAELYLFLDVFLACEILSTLCDTYFQTYKRDLGAFVSLASFSHTVFMSEYLCYLEMGELDIFSPGWVRAELFSLIPFQTSFD